MEPRPFTNAEIARLRHKESVVRTDKTPEIRAHIFTKNQFLFDYLNVANVPLDKWIENVFTQEIVLDREIGVMLGNLEWQRHMIDPLTHVLTAQGGFFTPGVDEETARQVVLGMVLVGYTQSDKPISYYQVPADNFLTVLPDIEHLLRVIGITNPSEKTREKTTKTLLSLINEGTLLHKKATDHHKELLVDLETELFHEDRQLNPQQPNQPISTELGDIIRAIFNLPPEKNDSRLDILNSSFPNGIRGLDTLLPSRRGKIPDIFQHTFADTGIPGIDKLPPPPSNTQQTNT